MGLLSLAIWTPIAFGVLLLAFGSDKHAGAVRWLALIGSLVALAVTVPLYVGFDNTTAAAQFVVEAHGLGGRCGRAHVAARRSPREPAGAEQVHPLFRALWQPRLIAALERFEQWIAADAAEKGRTVLATEISGEMVFDGVTVMGRADRIDRLADGTLAVVDYKTGAPPAKKQVTSGYALQLLTGKCPWQYTSGWHIMGLIRLDYAPAWLFFAFLLETIYLYVLRQIAK